MELCQKRIQKLFKKMRKYDFVKVSFITDINDINLRVNQAIPCRLIINEIIPHTYKHAFEGMLEDRILVTLKEKGQNIVLFNGDDGKGLGKAFLPMDADL